MYGAGTQSGLAGNRAVDAPMTVQDAQKQENIGSINQGTIKRLHNVVDSLDTLLNKVRGAQPAKTGPLPEEMPCVMSHARTLCDLSAAVEHRVYELHQIIGE